MLLSDICEIIMGQSPSSDSYNVKGQGLPFFQGNADFGKLYPSVRLWCNCPIKKAEAGDLLVSVRAPIGAVNLANQKCCIGRGLAALRPYRDKCDAMYLYYLIKAGKNKLNWLGTGSTFKAITRSSLLSFNVPDYCIAFQRKISGKLWSVDKLIHQRNEQLKLFDLLIQSRFVELFGNPVINQKRFPVKQVGDVIDFIGGSQPPKNVFEYTPTEENIRLIQIRDYRTDKYKTYIPRKLAKRFCTADDIMIGRYGPPIFQILGGIEGSYNVALMKAVPKMGNREFIRWFLKQECLLHYLEGMSKRTAGQDGIQMDKLKKYPFPYPPIELQNQFANFAKQLDKSKYRGRIFLRLLEDASHML